jgi:hypothetical protein
MSSLDAASDKVASVPSIHHIHHIINRRLFSSVASYDVAIHVPAGHYEWVGDNAKEVFRALCQSLSRLFKVRRCRLTLSKPS